MFAFLPLIAVLILHSEMLHRSFCYSSGKRVLTATNTLQRFKNFKCRSFHNLSTSSHVGINIESERLLETRLFTSFTFYKFANPKLNNTDILVSNAQNILSHLYIKGTLVFAPEGLNAQVTIPTQTVPEFHSLLSSIHPFLADVNLNIGEAKAFEISDDGNTPNLPFKKFVIKSKSKILTDGIIDDQDICWVDAGPELHSEDWHNELSSRIKMLETSTSQTPQKPSPKSILLDCRNSYETEMGTFRESTPLNTTVFSETWERLDQLLDSVPKDTRILTFCTGGIRCVKVNAYLRQKLGFSNTARLKDGIVGYERWLEDAAVDRLFNIAAERSVEHKSEGDDDNLEVDFLKSIEDDNRTFLHAQEQASQERIIVSTILDEVQNMKKPTDATETVKSKPIETPHIVKKGLRAILQERGLWQEGMKLKDARRLLNSHSIVAAAATADDSDIKIESHFIGENFVFDRRRLKK